MTLGELIRDVYSRLNESNNTTIADLPSGSGATSTIATAAQIATYLMDGGADLCRRCWRLSDKGTYTVPASTQYVPFSSLVTTAGHVIRSARTAQWTPSGGTIAELQEYDLAYLELRYPSYQTDATGTPTKWYRYGDTGVGIYARPTAATGVLTIDGQVGQPALVTGKTVTAATNAAPVVVTSAAHGLVNGDTVFIAGALGNTAANGTWTVANKTTDTFELSGSTGNGAWVSGGTIYPYAGSPTWLAADLHYLLSLFAAEMVARKALEDASVGPRATMWEQEYEDRVARLNADLFASDPYTAQAHFIPIAAKK